MLRCINRLEQSAGVDLDELLSYSTVRTVKIKDRRLGCLMLASYLAIFLYLIIYEILIKKSYRVTSSIIGTAGMDLERPAPAYRWNPGPPYCKGINASLTNPSYVVYPDQQRFTYTNKQGESYTADQYDCEYLDAGFASKGTLEERAAFLATSRISNLETAFPADGSCSRMQSTNCSWTVQQSSQIYVADTGMFLITLDHSLTTDVGISAHAGSMQGVGIRSVTGQLLDPCQPYKHYAAGCPAEVSVGKKGQMDRFPFQLLLEDRKSVV